jgi:hypothetical protein
MPPLSPPPPSSYGSGSARPRRPAYRDRRANGGRSNGENDASGPLGQVLENLQALTRELAEIRSEMATREDLKSLVSLAVYQANRESDSHRLDDHAGRLTAMEGEIKELTRTVYGVQVADARQFGHVQAAAAGANVAAVASSAGQRSASSDMLRSVQMIYGAIIGFLASGFIALLLYALNKK